MILLSGGSSQYFKKINLSKEIIKGKFEIMCVYISVEKQFLRG